MCALVLLWWSRKKCEMWKGSTSLVEFSKPKPLLQAERITISRVQRVSWVVKYFSKAEMFLHFLGNAHLNYSLRKGSRMSRVCKCLHVFWVKEGKHLYNSENFKGRVAGNIIIHNVRMICLNSQSPHMTWRRQVSAIWHSFQKSWDAV